MFAPVSTWHRFNETISGDDQCTRCAVVVSPEATDRFSLPCPAGDCPSPTNPDRGCVFTSGRTGSSVCIYCGRPGSRAGDRLPPRDDLELEGADA